MIDEETYVKLVQEQIPVWKFYAANERLNVLDRFKFIKLEKFDKKLLVWQAICSCGLKSEPFVTSSTLTFQLYIKECLEKRLLPFIKHHKSQKLETIFWPDLASYHYVRKTIEWYDVNEIKFFTKELNPPNSPLFRPIERYWANVKRIIKDTRVKITNDKDMKENWNKCGSKVNWSFVQVMMCSISRKVRKYLHTGEMLD